MHLTLNLFKVRASIQVSPLQKRPPTAPVTAWQEPRNTDPRNPCCSSRKQLITSNARQSQGRKFPKKREAHRKWLCHTQFNLLLFEFSIEIFFCVKCFAWHVITESLSTRKPSSRLSRPLFLPWLSYIPFAWSAETHAWMSFSAFNRFSRNLYFWALFSRNLYFWVLFSRHLSFWHFSLEISTSEDFSLEVSTSEHFSLEISTSEHTFLWKSLLLSTCL